MSAPAPRMYRGFLVTYDPRPAAADAPWRAWRDDGTKFRADTLAGVRAGVRELVNGASS